MANVRLTAHSIFPMLCFNVQLVFSSRSGHGLASFASAAVIALSIFCLSSGQRMGSNFSEKVLLLFPLRRTKVSALTVPKVRAM